MRLTLVVGQWESRHSQVGELPQAAHRHTHCPTADLADKQTQRQTDTQTKKCKDKETKTQRHKLQAAET